MAKAFVCSSSEPVVQTGPGKIRGYMIDGTYTFHGIKYADAQRFQPPVPVAPWEGIRDALTYGYVAPILRQPVPSGELLIPHRYWPENEHCQYLNVWTRSLDPDAKKPVMFWIHGGGFADGSSIEMAAYDGDNLSTYGDVVVVSVNHRLNILGYLDLSAYDEKYKNSGNAGMEDLVAALRWVRENIAVFGGDPDNVTIFGQSGGGMKVTVLCQTPAAKGLFHKGIVMSGVAEPAKNGDRISAAVAAGLLDELGLAANDAEKLEKIPYSKLAAVHRKVDKKLRAQGVYHMWGPVPNDWYPGDPLAVDFTENAKSIPLMVGSVIAEFGFGPGVANKSKFSADERRSILFEQYGEYTDRLISLFKKAYPDKNELDLLIQDAMVRQPTLSYATKRSETGGAPVYTYLFTLEFDVDDGKPAWHCADIPYVFHNADKVAVCNIEGVSDRLEEQLSGSYVSFARHGNPNHPLLPHWPEFTPQRKATMVFDRACEVRVDSDAELISLLLEAKPPIDLAKMMPAPTEDDEV